ncbi:MAG: hypothetical protein ACYCVB_07340 [Bacilli bacterium]
MADPKGKTATELANVTVHLPAPMSEQDANECRRQLAQTVGRIVAKQIEARVAKEA